MGSCSAKERKFISAADAGFTIPPPPQTPAGQKSEAWYTCDGDMSLHPDDQSRSGDIPPEPVNPYASASTISYRPSPPGLVRLALTKKSEPKVVEKYNMTSDDKNVDLLAKGGSLYFFACVHGKKLKQEYADTIALMVNRSMFADEAKENYSPPVDMKDPAFRNKHTFMLNKACYILPEITSKDFSPELLSSYWYQENCQTTATSVWKDGQKDWKRDHNTFRITKHIIPLFFNLTIQFKCSDMKPDALAALSPIMDGLQVHRGILMERTKRDGKKQDATKKAKSVILMHDFKGGVLIVNSVVGVQSSVPSWLAGVVDTFGGKGAAEVAETCDNTRKFFREYLKNR